MRNFAVLHIVAEESRIFKTKERCPLLLCIEVYRPTEIALEQIPDAITMQREIAEKIKPGAKNFEIQSNSQVTNDAEDPFSNKQQNRVSKNKNFRSQTMTSSFMDQQNAYPFGNIEEEVISTNRAKPAARNSMTMSRNKLHKENNNEIMS